MTFKRRSDSHYFDCPKCEHTGTVRPIDKDHHGNYRYQCGTCNGYFVEASLKYAALERFRHD